MAKTKLVLIEDVEPVVNLLRSALADEFDLTVAGNAKAGVDAVCKQQPEVVLVDLGLLHGANATEGLEIVSQLREAGFPVRVVVCTGQEERELAAKAVRLGAWDVLFKPLDLGLLMMVVRRAAWMAELEREGQPVHSATVSEQTQIEEMVGTSQSIRRIFEAIRKVSTTDVPVLITGESGTGKELTARAIHDRSARKSGPFVPINCGAIPDNLLESELFGYERGAFTGAVQQKKGKVEAAEGGTLFLDEVGELPLALQVKLLRFLQDRTFERVGGRQAIEINVRIIAATNVNLKDAIERGLFREDLYYRLGVVHINMPPLRERGEDVLLLAMVFLREAASHQEKRIQGFTKEALDALQAFPWPGNVRELSNRIRRAVVMAEGSHITPADLDLQPEEQPVTESSISLKVNQQRIETDLIMKAFTLSHGNLSRAALELGISRSTLYRRLRQYGLHRASEVLRPS